MTKQYCIRGHDTFVVGRTQRMCRECRRLNDRARYRRNTDKRKAQTRRWYLAKGFLNRLNRTVDSAVQKLEALLGNQ